jgi:hypothetical protein
VQKLFSKPLLKERPALAPSKWDDGNES